MQNGNTIEPSGRELYHLQFSLQAASLETFGYILVLFFVFMNLSMCGLFFITDSVWP
jgi:hypothetical protein